MKRKHSLALACLLTASAIPCLALSDPCTADVTRFRPGQTFSGAVRYVGDGDSICVGSSADPASWIEVRLENWFAPEMHDVGGREAKALMTAIAMGRPASCVARTGHNGRTVSYDRVIATCSIGGRDLAVLARSAGGRQGGKGFQ